MQACSFKALIMIDAALCHELGWKGIDQAREIARYDIAAAQARYLQLKFQPIRALPFQFRELEASLTRCTLRVSLGAILSSLQVSSLFSSESLARQLFPFRFRLHVRWGHSGELLILLI